MAHAFPIRNDHDYRRALDLIDSLWDAEPATEAADLLEVMATLVERYEQHHRDLPPPDPVELIRFKLAELKWTQNELGRRLGWGGGRVSEVLSRRRPLTLRMVQSLSRVLNLPPGLLVPDACDDGETGQWVRLDPQAVQHAEETAGAKGISIHALVNTWIASFTDPSSGGVAPTAGRRMAA